MLCFIISLKVVSDDCICDDVVRLSVAGLQGGLAERMKSCFFSFRNETTDAKNSIYERRVNREAVKMTSKELGLAEMTWSGHKFLHEMTKKKCEVMISKDGALISVFIF